MGIKLFERLDKPLESKEAGVIIELGNMLPEDEAEMGALQYASKAPQTTIALYALRNCVTKLSVGGKDYNPQEVSLKVRPAKDKDAAALLYTITALVIEHVLMTEEQLKKLEQQRKTSSQEKAPSDAANARSTDGDS